MSLNAEADRQLRQRFGVGYSHYLALSGVVYLQGCNQKQLAEFMQLTSAGALHNLKELERRGWVTKQSPYPGSRSVLISLTNEGRSSHHEMNALLTKRLHEILSVTPAELRQLSGQLESQMACVRPGESKT